MDLEALYKLDKVLNSIPPKKSASLNATSSYPVNSVPHDDNKPKTDANHHDSEREVKSSIEEESKPTEQSNTTNIILTEEAIRKEESSVVDDDSVVVKPTVWTKYFDAATVKFYYHNAQTNVTQWETPSDGIIDTSFIAPVSYPSSSSSSSSATTISSSLSSSSTYSVRANFAANNGSFASVGETSYWDKVGRPDDRAGRQMAAFFDVSGLELNREEARDKKTRLQQSGVDWREYKEAKQQEKKKRRSEWLRND